jgi:hypothetical protein
MDTADLEHELDCLIERYEELAALVETARGEYFALAEATTATPAAITRAQARWHKLERQRQVLRRDIDILEDRSAA